MANMQLGTYVFQWQPVKWTIPKEERFLASVTTYTSVVFFSFGTSMVGKQIVLEWDWMPRKQFDRLNALYLSDIAQTWIPGDGGTYVVEIIGLEAEYFEVTDLNFDYREKVKMGLVIKSVTTAAPAATTTTTTTTA